MLEGQVAVLSSGQLSADESLELLEALKQSTLYRKDQNSYILYPNKALPKFVEKNSIPSSSIERSALLLKLLNDNNVSIIEKDVKGVFHFNGNFKNADDVLKSLNNLSENYKPLVEKDKIMVLQIFEEVFNHKEFTGRSGTFFAFEGLGSIYWHMVSKLLLAVQETCIRAINQNAEAKTISKLIAHYYGINEGIGVHKPPQLYGAFPITPYSHTPLHKGAQQPGMTGQVKEDILCRIGELGVQVENGLLVFNPQILRRAEFLEDEKEMEVLNVNGETKRIVVEKNSLLFTYCQVPVIYTISDSEGVDIERKDGSKNSYGGFELSKKDTEAILKRTGDVLQVKVYMAESRFRK